jgi:hypothetical protein
MVAKIKYHKFLHQHLVQVARIQPGPKSPGLWLSEFEAGPKAVVGRLQKPGFSHIFTAWLGPAWLGLGLLGRAGTSLTPIHDISTASSGVMKMFMKSHIYAEQKMIFHEHFHKS